MHLSRCKLRMLKNKRRNHAGKNALSLHVGFHDIIAMLTVADNCFEVLKSEVFKRCLKYLGLLISAGYVVVGNDYKHGG